MSQPGTPVPARPTPGQICTAVVLVAVVTAIIGVAFRGSWGAFRDAALAAHFDRDAANLYPFAVDGLLIIAILAAVLLRHDRGARRYTLGIIAGYTSASWLINFLHGLGMFLPDPATGQRPVPPWPVVGVIATLVIGSIFLGSHLLVYVWRHLYPTAAAAPESAEVYQPGTPADHDGTPVPAGPANNYEAAKSAYWDSLSPGRERLSQRTLMDRFGISKRAAARVQDEVEQEQASEPAAPGPVEPADVPAQYTPNGRAEARTGT